MYFIKADRLKAQNTYDSKVAMTSVGCHVIVKEMSCTVSSAADCIALQFSICFSS